jgi:multidrug efflux pump subunit AcrA (membrane-fusion protein)
MKQGKMSSVTVETGASNDTSTEITSGINEGDIVVTSVISSATRTSTTTTTSPFSALGGRGAAGAGGGGNFIRTGGR